MCNEIKPDRETAEMWLGILWIEWKLFGPNVASQACWNTAYVNIFATLDLVPVINETRKPKSSDYFFFFPFLLSSWIQWL